MLQLIFGLFQITMSKVFFKPYSSFQITGTDFETVSSDAFRRIVFSPDGVHAISVVSLRDGTLLFTNDSDSPFEFTLSRNHKTLAVVKYSRESTLTVNSNWRISASGVKNCEIHSNPDLIISKHINIELQGAAFARADLKINNTGFACCIFSDNRFAICPHERPSCFSETRGFRAKFNHDRASGNVPTKSSRHGASNRPRHLR